MPAPNGGRSGGNNKKKNGDLVENVSFVGLSFSCWKKGAPCCALSPPLRRLLRSSW